MVLTLKFTNMKNAVRTQNLVKMTIILSAIGVGTLLGKSITSVARR